MNRFEQLIQEDLRLVIIQVLNSDADYSHNESVLKGALRSVGHTVSTDRLRTELQWLAEQGLVRTEDVGGIVVARLTARGQDAATGAATIPGVKRPAPVM